MDISIEDAYVALGIPPGAPAGEVKAAWRRLASRWHPDRNPSAEAAALMQRINGAYERLMGARQDDDATAQAARNLYPSQQGMKPFVARCDTVGADNFFVGTNSADTMDHVVRACSGDEATKCTSEFEDPAFANALRLHGKLGRLISVRSASDFETPPPGQTAD